MNAIVNRDEVRKAVVESLSNPSEDIARHVLAMAGANPSQIEKAITTGTGLVAYDLQAPAKNLIQSSGLVKAGAGGASAATALSALDVAGVGTLKTIGQSLVSTAIATVLGKLAPAGASAA